MNETVDRRALRKAIRGHIEGTDTALWSDLIEAVAADLDVDRTDVGRELDALERAGFIYCVSSDDGEEVRLA